MKQEYNSKVVKSKHLTSSERGKIETYVEAKMSISEIARKMGRAKSTICVEIRRSRYNGRYDANIAHKRAQKRRKESHKHTKWRDVNLLNFIEKHLKKRWSPEIISMQLKKEKGWKFSHSSIYTLIKKHRPEWMKYLINKGRKRRKLTHPASAKFIPERVSIDKRPEIVGTRERFGDWEADTVVSCRGGKACLAVFVERKTRMYLIKKMKDKSAAEMLAATIRALGNYHVKTISYDNGTENANHIYANNILNCKSFFCNPYHSWEKGAIENRNKILRQFLPKGTNFDLISEDEILNIQNAINGRPMKALAWHSPAQAFSRLAFGLLL